MKKLLSIIATLSLLFGMTVFAAEKSIVEIAVDDDNFSILVAALQEADLVDALSGDGPFTVFAPTNAAFEALLADLGITAEQLLSQSMLADVLLYHVVEGEVLSSALTEGMEATTLNGEKITFTLDGGAKVNGSVISAVDIEATNGVIHVIDKVLVPAGFELDAEEPAAPENSIVEIALGNENFSILVAALQKADLVGALSGEGPFTVFAPTNAAFEQLLATLNITADELLNQPDLAKVLLFHVVSGKVMSSALEEGMEAETLNGESITFTLEGGAKVNGSVISAVDIEATNGVIHVIDTVIIPENFVYVDLNEDEELPDTSATSLILLGLASLVAGSGALFVTRKRKEDE